MWNIFSIRRRPVFFKRHSGNKIMTQKKKWWGEYSGGEKPGSEDKGGIEKLVIKPFA